MSLSISRAEDLTAFVSTQCDPCRGGVLDFPLLCRSQIFLPVLLVLLLSLDTSWDEAGGSWRGWTGAETSPGEEGVQVSTSWPLVFALAP